MGEGKFSSLSLNPEAKVFTPSSSAFLARQVHIHHLVRASGKPNFAGLRIPLETHLNIPEIRRLSKGFPDQLAVDFLEFGFPINYVLSEAHLPTAIPRNHKGARDFPQAVDKYLEKEITLGATLGPCDENPLKPSPLAISPVNTVEKNTLDPNDRRIISNASFPSGASVNDGIPKESFLGDPFKLELPGMDEFIDLVNKFGRGALMYKRDLSRAFRQLLADPADWNKLGFCWKGKFYVDRALVMGLRTSSICCQKTTDLVVFIAREQAECFIVNYLDDMDGVDTPEHAWVAFEFLGELLVAMGLIESLPKALSPRTSMPHLGILVDTLLMIMQITPDRMEAILAELHLWQNKAEATKKELQSLLGKLLFVSKCVYNSRIFLSRLLNLLREAPEEGGVMLSDDARRDIHWFQVFMPTHNGVSLIPEPEWSEPDVVFATDACLVGLGGVCGQDYFTERFPDHILEQNLHISALEMLAVTVGIRLWGHKLTRKRITIFCDNKPTVITISSGKTKCPFMQGCLRELCFWLAKADCQLRVVHLSSEENRLPDLLSRAPIKPNALDDFLKLTKHMVMKQVVVPGELFSHANPW